MAKGSRQGGCCFGRRRRRGRRLDQAVSGAGKEGIDELTDQTKAYSEGREMEAHILPSASLPKHYTARS